MEKVGGSGRVKDEMKREEMTCGGGEGRRRKEKRNDMVAHAASSGNGQRRLATSKERGGDTFLSFGMAGKDFIGPRHSSTRGRCVMEWLDSGAA